MAKVDGIRARLCTVAGIIFFAAAAMSAENLPPTIEITGNGWGPYSVFPNATAIDPDGFVEKVEFYANGQRLGESTSSSPPYYTYWWTNIAVGVYSITA